MSSRSIRRRQHKVADRLTNLQEQERQVESQSLLAKWQRGARHRARFLSAPEVWRLAELTAVRQKAAAVDQSGELQQDLNRVCAEAIAEASSRQLVSPARLLGGRLRG